MLLAKAVERAVAAEARQAQVEQHEHDALLAPERLEAVLERARPEQRGGRFERLHQDPQAVRDQRMIVHEQDPPYLALRLGLGLYRGRARAAVIDLSSWWHCCRPCSRDAGSSDCRSRRAAPARDRRSG